MPADPGIATLTVRTKRGGTRAMDLGLLKKIDLSYSVTLSEISTMVYGYRENFCMDLGTLQKLDVTVERVNPQPYNDNQNTDSTLWSNGRWYNELESMFDFWQNFGLNPRDTSTSLLGGMLFTFEPSDETLYPYTERTVFMAGALNMSTKVQKMTVSIPLVVARMSAGAGGAAQRTIIHFVSRVPSLTATGSALYGIKTKVPSMPTEWADANPDEVLDYWTDADGNTYTPGDNVVWTSQEVTLYANWRGALAIWIWSIHHLDSWTGSESNPQWVSHEVPSGASEIRAYLIGGGGGAGSCLDTGTNGYYIPGGAGGAGQFVEEGFQVFAGDMIRCAPGKGGAGRTTSVVGDEGGSGEATVLYIGGAESLSAGGGSGGRRSGPGVTAGTGGQQYKAGGTATTSYPGTGERGHTGDPSQGEMEGIPGEPSSSSQWSSASGVSRQTYFGGGGGGASAFNRQFRLGGVTYSLLSRGGNAGQIDSPAGSSTERADGLSGDYGGGGGSGCGDGARGGNGGGGLAVVVVY